MPKSRKPRTLSEVVSTLPKGERAKIDARAQDLVAEEMSLRQLRKAIGKTQATVAKRLKVGQDAVSKLEIRGDMYISTLRGVLKAMGGELELIARFPHRPPVRLEEIGKTAPRRKPRSEGRPRRTAAGRRLAGALNEVLDDVRGTKRLPVVSRSQR